MLCWLFRLECCFSFRTSSACEFSLASEFFFVVCGVCEPFQGYFSIFCVKFCHFGFCLVFAFGLIYLFIFFAYCRTLIAFQLCRYGFKKKFQQECVRSQKCVKFVINVEMDNWFVTFHSLFPLVLSAHIIIVSFKLN